MTRLRTTLFLSLLLGTLGCDQGTKRIAEATLAGAEPVTMLRGTVRLVYAENTGAFGSLGASWPPVVKTLTLSLLPLGFLAFVLVHAWRTPDLPTLQVVGIALFAGGGLGNVIDRLWLGYVVDFMWLGVGGLGTNVFNVADVALLGGVGLFFVGSRRGQAGRVEGEGGRR